MPRAAQDVARGIQTIEHGRVAAVAIAGGGDRPGRRRQGPAHQDRGQGQDRRTAGRRTAVAPATRSTILASQADVQPAHQVDQPGTHAVARAIRLQFVVSGLAAVGPAAEDGVAQAQPAHEIYAAAEAGVDAPNQAELPQPCHLVDQRAGAGDHRRPGDRRRRQNRPAVGRRGYPAEAPEVAPHRLLGVSRAWAALRSAVKAVAAARARGFFRVLDLDIHDYARPYQEMMIRG